MSEITIVESGMTFGPFPAESCFYIEKSQTYAKCGEKVKMVEFLFMRMGKHSVASSSASEHALWVVEAKKSAPKPTSIADSEKYILELREKFSNGLQLGIAAYLGRHQVASSEFPSTMKTLDLSTTKVVLVLVIKAQISRGVKASRKSCTKRSL